MFKNSSLQTRHKGKGSESDKGYFNFFFKRNIIINSEALKVFHLRKGISKLAHCTNLIHHLEKSENIYIVSVPGSWHRAAKSLGISW